MAGHEQVEFSASGGRRTACLHRPPPPVRATALFAHELPGGAADRIATRLAERGVAVLSCGFAEAPPEAADVAAAADFLRSGHQAPALVIGHGRGGSAAISAAAAISEARAVAAINAPPDSDRSADALHLLDRPLLLLHADAAVGEEMFGLARHPKSLVALDGADHALSCSRDADAAAELIAAWSDRYLPPLEAAADAGAGMVLVTETGDGRFGQTIAAGRHRLRADEPRKDGGLDTGPTPYDLLLAALGACSTMTMRLYADRHGWPLVRSEVRLNHARVHARDCAECETRHASLDRIEREILLDGPLSDEQREGLLRIAERCPVHRTLTTETVIASKLAPRKP